MREITSPAAPSPDSVEPEESIQAWNTLLTRMEEDIAAGPAALLSPEDQVQWTTPVGIGPLPAALADRARSIVLAQETSLAELQNERRAVGKHLGALRSVSGSRQGPQPVYLDVTG